MLLAYLLLWLADFFLGLILEYETTAGIAPGGAGRAIICLDLFDMEDLQIQLRKDHRRKRWINGVCVGAGQALSLPLALILGGVSPWWWVYLVLWLAATGSLYRRYEHPVRATVLVVAGVGITILAPEPYIAIWWPVPLMVYHWARYGSKSVRAAVLVGSSCSALLGGWVFLGFFRFYDWDRVEQVAMYLFATSLCLALVVIAWFFGDSQRLRENRHRALIERNRQLLHEREQERALAALDERARIAREMHDIVAHSLSVIIAQADGARYAAGAASARDREPVELAALSTISDAARSSLQQMRTLLGVLRTNEGRTVEPLSALHNLPQLIEQTQKLGIPVEFTGVSGVEEKLPAGAELTVYRIVQEALTNVAKHCPGTPLVSVVMSQGKHTLDIDIRNQPQKEASNPPPGARRGLLGMRERVDMYGGSLHYGKLADGSFRVFVQIPFAR